jgi:hypothetical protein
MSDLTDLYQSVILDHSKRPRNRVASGDNASCRDNCTVWLRLDGDRIAGISFEGQGCAISQASASLMTTQLEGKTDAEAAFADFKDIVTTRTPVRGVFRGRRVRRRPCLPRAHQVRDPRLARRPRGPQAARSARSIRRKSKVIKPKSPTSDLRLLPSDIRP